LGRGVKGAEEGCYERLTDVLAEYPAVCMCEYDVRLFDGATIMDVLSTHPYTHRARPIGDQSALRRGRRVSLSATDRRAADRETGGMA
jgi:hypothetical protein